LNNGDGAVSTIQNIRVVVDHDQTVTLGSAGSACDNGQDLELWLYGYLISVNSPSLAP
jgi:hypothetical protein